MRSNYIGKSFNAKMWPIDGVDAYSELAICADVIVNGANASTFTLDAPQLSSEQPCKGVILSGNSHCVDAVRCVQPGENLSSTVVAGVILASAEGVIMQANVASGCQEHYPAQRCVAVVSGNRSHVSLDMNEGWLAGDFSGWDLLGKPRRLAALKTTDASAVGQDGEMQRHGVYGPFWGETTPVLWRDRLTRMETRYPQPCAPGNFSGQGGYAHLRVRDIEAGKVTIDPIPESEGVSYGSGFVSSSAEFYAFGSNWCMHNCGTRIHSGSTIYSLT